MGRATKIRISVMHFASPFAMIAAIGLATAASAQEAADKAITAGAPPAAPAPAAPVAPAPAAGAPGAVEEIVVTAERRVQNLQDVPISATVLNARDLARRGVASIADIQQVAPSIAINTVNRSTFINIRGVGIAQSAPTSNPGVAYYIDGQLIPHEQFIAQSFYDYGSIEVLRGPQGTLTGQNSTGGAIYIRTPDPEFDHVSGYVEQSAANYASYRTVAALNVPFGDDAAVRASATRDKRDSFTTNIGPSGSQPGNLDLLAGRVNLALRSGDHDICFNLRADGFTSRSDNNAVKRRNDVVSTDPYVIEEDGRSYQDQRGFRTAAELRLPIVAGVDLRGFGAYQRVQTLDQTDGDRTATAAPRPPAANVGRVSDGSTRFNTRIGEINLLSTRTSPFTWVVGGFLLDEFIHTDLIRDNNHVTDFVSSTSTISTRAHNISRSLFGQANYYLAKRLELIVGARHSWDKQVYDRNIVNSVVQPDATKTGIQKSSVWTGKVGINYHVDATLLYVTASKGYKAGGVNLTVGTPNFAPETNKVFEAGFKTTVLDRHLRVNGDIFYSDYKSIQLSSLLNGLPVTQNAASGRSYGAELEVTGQFGQFAANFGGGYLHGRFSNDSCINDTNNPAGQRALCPSASATQADSRVLDGDRLPFAPTWTLNGGVQYEIRVSDGLTLTPRAQWSHLSSQIATPFRSAFTIVPGRDLFDARLTADLGRRFRLEAYVMNLGNKTYIASQIQDSSSTTGGIIYGAPRTYGVRATVRFGN